MGRRAGQVVRPVTQAPQLLLTSPYRHPRDERSGAVPRVPRPIPVAQPLITANPTTARATPDTGRRPERQAMWTAVCSPPTAVRPTPGPLALIMGDGVNSPINVR